MTIDPFSVDWDQPEILLYDLAFSFGQAYY